MKKTINESIPVIYCYTTPGIPYNDGWCKIGYTERNAEKRIAEQTHTAGIQANIEWILNAVYEGGSGCFSDHDFHAYLRTIGIENRDNTEWFNIDPIDAKSHFYTFKERAIVKTKIQNYTLRQEQEEAVASTTEFVKENEGGEFLWNAKPRFGKTLSVYDFCNRIDAQNVLIVTGRPAIANSWYDDYMKFMGRESGYSFVSEVDELKGKEQVVTWDDFDSTRKKNVNHKYKCIYFVSLQNLKGSKYFGSGPYDKLKEIRSVNWDVLVIDEAHEGVDTYKTEVAFNQIKRKFTLHLTGTAFKALVKGQFNDDAIYSWTYVNEQEMKKNWSGTGSNPYLELPQLTMISYRLQNILKDEIASKGKMDEDSEYAFKLNMLFETDGNGKFKHESAVDKFLDTIASNEKYPFSDEFGSLKHTFWLLYRVSSVKALEKKLREHPFFKDYDVVIAAGDGKKEDYDDFQANKTSFHKVRAAIDNCDKNNKKGTITLSVGQLTTGITVPEWTAVLILSEWSSPERYMQTIFRVQNPWFYCENDKWHRKENAYVFDFNQEKALTMMEAFAQDLSNSTAGGKGTFEERTSNVKRLIDCFPIYGEDDQGVVDVLSPERILTIPRELKSDEVVRRKFMSNELFKNIDRIFGAPTEIQQIFRKMPSASKNDPGVNINPNTAKELYLNENGEVDIPSYIIDNKTNNVISEASRNKLKEDLTKTISQTHPGMNTDEKLEREKVQNAFINKSLDKIIDSVKEAYPDLPESKIKELRKVAESQASNEIAKAYLQANIDKAVVEDDIKETFDDIDESEQEALHELIQENCTAINNDLADKLANALCDLIDDSAKQATKDIETSKIQKQKDTHEDEIRNHLRGFARTIPSFIMAYGADQDCIAKHGPLTLENFDKFVSDTVFKEVTGINLTQFKLLRDGGVYTDAEFNTQQFDGHVFDEVVFNDSIQKFLELKQRLAEYFDDKQVEDIFDYIPLQKTNQKFTPKHMVSYMVDQLDVNNPGCFDDSNKTFIDIYMKSGLFITEIVKRLYRSEKMKELYPDPHDRLKHIFEHQVYGLAPTEIIYRIAMSFIFGSELTKDINTKHIVCFDAQPYAENGTLESKLDEIFNDK